MRSDRMWFPGFLLLFAAALPLGCGGGSASSSSDPLVLLDVSVGGSAGVPLNAVIEVSFNLPLDPDSVRPDTIRVRGGPNFTVAVPGTLETDGEVVRFRPRVPTAPDLSDGGLRAGETYRVIVPGHPAVATVRSSLGERPTETTEVDFRTVDPGGRLFVDNWLDPLPPRVVSANPADGANGVPTASALVLTFTRRPLHPASVTPSNVSLTLVSRDGRTLERAVPGEPVLAQAGESVQVRFVPDFPLADRATYRLSVSRRVMDLGGNDVEPFECTFTTADEPARPGEVVVNFTPAELATIADVEETTASWSDEVPGALAALFTVAGGDGTAGDFAPTADRTVTPDDFPGGVRAEVVDGVTRDVYHFRSLRIPAGVTVRFAPRAGGENRPVSLLSLRDVEISGTIDISGGAGVDGESSSITSRIPLAAGGTAGPGGTAGADGYTGSGSVLATPVDAADLAGGPEGGRGGRVSGHGTYSYSGGGGGGASRVDGHDGTGGGSGTSAYNGAGGRGGRSPASRGFPANVERTPNLGGTGGGAGGLGYYRPTSTNGRQGAGAGGGGGGAITIQSAGDVRFGGAALLRADGGDGGGTTARSSYYGGAGGGGGGGSILVRATKRVVLTPGVRISVAGGKGGPFSYSRPTNVGGLGGDGGDGYVRIEAGADAAAGGAAAIDGLADGLATEGSLTTGVFAPRGGGAPSLGQTRFLDLGVFEPRMIRPAAGDVLATRLDDEIEIEVQMALEDGTRPGSPDLGALDAMDTDGDGRFDDTLDPARLSEWTPLADIETLNGRGYSFLRVRVVFQLDPNQGPDDPLPSLDRLRIPYDF